MSGAADGATGGAGEVRGVGADIARILEQGDALEELVFGNDGEPEGNQVYDFNVRWGALLAGRLERLRHFYQRDELDDGQRADYLRMEQRLREMVPLTERIDVSRPTAPPEDPESR